MAGGASPSGGGAQAFASTLTDLMTSLAVIFILLLVVFLKQAHDQSKKAKDEVREQLEALLEQKSLALRQDPEDPLTLAVAVGENQLRFPVGGHTLSSDGAGFISGFFRNFSEKICSSALKDKVDSIMIEGHTDTSGEKTEAGVRRNIELSQKRSFSVLDQALKSVQNQGDNYECLLKLASATGRGSRSGITVNGTYHPEMSRRVEIKIRVRSAEQQFKKLLGATAVNVAPHPLAPAPTIGPAGPAAAPFAAPPIVPAPLPGLPKGLAPAPNQ